MKYYNKNVDGEWKTFALSDSDIDQIKEEVIKEYKKSIAIISSDKTLVTAPKEFICLLLDKLVPSFDSIANDFISDAIKKSKSN